MKTKHLDIAIEIKSLSEDGTFEGMLSPYGSVDQGNDVVEQGAFTKSLSDNGDTVPMLWQHKQDSPIGTLTLTDQTDGLYCKGQLFLDKDENGNYFVPDAAKAYALLKAGIIKGLSIGYETVQKQVINGVRYLKQLTLFEGSVVTFPMNLSAGVNSVKAHNTKGLFADALADNQVSQQFYLLLQSLSGALSPLPWSGATRDDILASAQEILEEFSAAYMAYLPTYLDYLSREYGMDTKEWSGKREVKEGRKISADTHKALSEVKMHCKSAFDGLDDMLSDCDDPDDPDCDDEEYKAHTEFIATMRGLFQ